MKRRKPTTITRNNEDASGLVGDALGPPTCGVADGGLSLTRMRSRHLEVLRPYGPPHPLGAPARAAGVPLGRDSRRGQHGRHAVSGFHNPDPHQLTDVRQRPGSPDRELVGGPSPEGPYPLPGRVYARAGNNKGKVIATATAGSDGGFQVSLPSGPYVLTHTAPLSIGGDCHSDPVTVSPHLTVTATVICGGPRPWPRPALTAERPGPPAPPNSAADERRCSNPASGGPAHGQGIAALGPTFPSWGSLPRLSLNTTQNNRNQPQPPGGSSGR